MTTTNFPPPLAWTYPDGVRQRRRPATARPGFWLFHRLFYSLFKKRENNQKNALLPQKKLKKGKHPRRNSGPTPVARGWLRARPITICPLDEVIPLINTLSLCLSLFWPSCRCKINTWQTDTFDHPNMHPWRRALVRLAAAHPIYHTKIMTTCRVLYLSPSLERSQIW